MLKVASLPRVTNNGTGDALMMFKVKAAFVSRQSYMPRMVFCSLFSPSAPSAMDLPRPAFCCSFRSCAARLVLLDVRKAAQRAQRSAE